MKLDQNVKKGVSARNSFDLSFDGVLSQSWGDLVPIVCKEMVPSDTFTCKSSVFVRLAPLATPTYGRIHGYVNYFFVPARILMTEGLWEDFIRGGVDGNQVVTLPYTTGHMLHRYAHDLADNISKPVKKLCTYLGLPDPDGVMDDSSVFRLSMLPFAAYNRIYGDYYFPWGVEDDADAEQMYFKKLSQGLNTDADANFTFWKKYFSCKRACFKKDYLTTAQTRPQRGGMVYAPVNTAAGASSIGQIVDPDNDPSLAANNAVSSMAIRWANSFQNFLERNNIAGARYFEQILARFGVKISAERLQRSEWLGGHDFYISVSDVTSTNGSEGGNLGDMAGKGVGLGTGSVTYTAQDYGFFIGIAHLMPESGVVQGINKMWTRQSRYDYFTPELEDTGMQPIYNSEVWGYLGTGTGFASNVRPSDTGVFGYIPRYAEYKFSAPLLAGDFAYRTDTSPADMDSMHLYRIFSTAEGGEVPVLNTEFLTLDDSHDLSFNRIFQDMNADFDHFWTNIQVSLQASRPMLGYAESSSPFTGDDDNASISVPYGGTRL